MGYFFDMLVVLGVICQSSEALERFCWKEIIGDTLPGLSLVISFFEGNDPIFLFHPCQLVFETFTTSLQIKKLL